MTNDDLIVWTASQVQTLLPCLQGSYLQEAVRYSLSLSAEDTNRHWRSLLGSSPQVDSFLKSLNERRNPPKPAGQQPAQTPRLSAPVPMSPSHSRLSSAEQSRTPSPSKVLRITSKPTTSIPKKRGPGKMTSDLGKPKPKAVVSPTAKAIEEGRPLTELEEIDSALQSISITSNPKRHECGCFGTIHDVYPICPNCLTCGRIICVAEGLGKCFFCGEELIDESQRDELVRELRIERGQAKTREANEKVKKVRSGNTGKRVWATKVGGQVGSMVYETETSETSSGYVTPNAYFEAEKRRDELLEFDRTFAERTKIIGIIYTPVHITEFRRLTPFRSTSRIHTPSNPPRHFLHPPRTRRRPPASATTRSRTSRRRTSASKSSSGHRFQDRKRIRKKRPCRRSPSATRAYGRGDGGSAG